VKRLLFAALAALLWHAPASAFDAVPRPVAPDGTHAVIDLPTGRHVRNAAGSDGSGLCVFTSLQVAADWHNVPQLAGLQAWMRSRPGGGYPEKVDAELTAYCAAQGRPTPAYVQRVGGDEAFLDLAVKTGRLVSVTYAGVDGFYRTPVLHMVNLAHLDSERAAVIDNNRPGVWVWMTPGGALWCPWACLLVMRLQPSASTVICRRFRHLRAKWNPGREADGFINRRHRSAPVGGNCYARCYSRPGARRGDSA
jgi:hypothetical protein